MLHLIFLTLLSLCRPMQAPTPPPCLHLMTYNIRLDLAADGIYQWSNRRERLPGSTQLTHLTILQRKFLSVTKKITFVRCTLPTWEALFF